MENQFDLGLNIASIETELPDPVITLSSADMLTASDTAEMPLLALTVYGRSWQDNSLSLVNIGDEGKITITSHGQNLCASQELEAGTFNENGERHETSTAVRTVTRTYLEAGTYTVSVTGAVRCVGYRYTNASVLKGTRIFDWTPDNMPQTFTLTEAAYCAFAFNKGPGINVTTDEIYAPMIESGDTVSTVKAEITTALPLQGVPVSSGGNFIDSSGQEWVCDTLEHVYGESAKIVKRTTNAVVTEKYDGRGYGAVVVSGASSWYGDYFELHYAYSNGQYWGRLKCKNGYGYLKDGVWTQNAATSYSLSLDSDTVFYGKVIWSDSGKPYSGALPLYTLSNGDAVPDSYISTTGTLSDGAVIVYPSGEETVTLTTKETEALSSLSGYKASTTVYNENTAEMTVKLLREDFEMQYIHWIKESQSFICEKAGKYKIICVGGGSSGGIGAPGAADVLQAVGTTTSFGSIISANGGGKSRTSASEKFEATGTVGGQSGYDGINYGSSSHILSSTGSSALSSTGSESTSMWGTGHGYGAGGGAKGMLIKYTKDTAVNLDMLACGGQCGRIESTIVDLEENQTVFCTVGGGGALNLSDANVLDYLKNYVDNAITETTAKGTELSACVTDGADGVIIVQYLGV